MPDSVAGLVPTTPAQMQNSVDTAMSALGGMDSQGFLKLLVAQLQYQSPMDPKDPGDLMIQTATLAQLDATQQLLAIQQRDLGMQQAVAAAGMLGAEVTAFDADGAVQGLVDTVRYTAAGPVLAIGDREVLFEDVRELRRPGQATSATTSVPGTVPGTVPIPDAYAPDASGAVPVPEATAPVPEPTLVNDPDPDATPGTVPIPDAYTTTPPTTTDA